MKFIKKPQVIEAFQMIPTRRVDNSEWPQWLHVAWNRGEGEIGSLFPSKDFNTRMGDTRVDELNLVTSESVVRVNWGDWIVQDGLGELSVCSPEVFDMTYDPVTE